MKNYKIGKINLIVICSMVAALACEDVPDFEPTEQVPVVEAFLYVGDPVDDITIKRVIPFESQEGEVFIDGLDIELIWNGKVFKLTNSDEGKGKYFYPGEDLEIIAENNYEIRFNFEDNQIYSNTTVPLPPANLQIGDDTIYLPQIVALQDLLELRDAESNNILVEWDNLSGDYFYVSVKNIETEPEAIDVNEVLNFNFEFVSTPTQSDFFTLIPFVHYTQFGTHRIVVYRVNEEYALLFETLEQDSRDLNEPFTNIQNGVGIFSGFASDTVFLEVIES